MEDVVRRIAKLRQSKRFSQSYMAEKLGMAPNNYGKIERGETELTIKRARQIADILSVDAAVLILGEGNNASSRDKNDKVEELEIKLESATVYLQESYAFFGYIFKVFLNEDLEKLSPADITLEKINELWTKSISVSIHDREKMKQLDIDSPIKIALTNDDIRDTVMILRDNIGLFLKTVLPKDHPLINKKLQ